MIILFYIVLLMVVIRLGMWALDQIVLKMFRDADARIKQFEQQLKDEHK